MVDLYSEIASLGKESPKNEGKTLWANPYVALLRSTPEATHGVLLPCIPRVGPKEFAAVQAKTEEYSETYCELGIGCGEHIIEQARAKPGALFVGFELRYKRIFKASQRAEKLGVKNLVLVRADARLLAEFFRENVISGCFVNFPDPWGRERWRKHRIMSSDLLTTLSTIMKSGACFFFKTDHQDSLKDLTALVGHFPCFRVISDLRPEQCIPTEFEKLFRSKGLPIYYLGLEKC